VCASQSGSSTGSVGVLGGGGGGGGGEELSPSSPSVSSESCSGGGGGGGGGGGSSLDDMLSDGGGSAPLVGGGGGRAEAGGVDVEAPLEEGVDLEAPPLEEGGSAVSIDDGRGGRCVGKRWADRVVNGSKACPLVTCEQGVGRRPALLFYARIVNAGQHGSLARDVSPAGG